MLRMPPSRRWKVYLSGLRGLLVPMDQSPFFVRSLSASGPGPNMRARILFLLTIAAALGLSSCKKEFIEGDTVQVVDTVSATNATTYTFQYSWDDTLYIGDESSAWSLQDTTGGLRIPMALNQGDRIIATLQVGLAQTGATLPCTDSLHVYLGAILGNGFSITPSTSGIVPFDGAFSVDSLWQENVWVKLFTRQQELTLPNAVSSPVVQTLTKLRSMHPDCQAGTAPCYVMSRALTLTVIHP